VSTSGNYYNGSAIHATNVDSADLNYSIFDESTAYYDHSFDLLATKNVSAICNVVTKCDSKKIGDDESFYISGEGTVTKKSERDELDKQSFEIR
jgi:hypothetical protein